MTQSKHTPTPEIISADQMPIIIMLAFDKEKFVPYEMNVKGFCKYVRADAHDDLVAALKGMMNKFPVMPSGLPCTEQIQAKAALAKAQVTA